MGEPRDGKSGVPHEEFEVKRRKERMRVDFEIVFDQNSTPQERLVCMEEKLGGFFTLCVEKELLTADEMESYRERFHQASLLEDRAAFVAAHLKIAEELLVKTPPRELETIRRRLFVEQGKFTPANEAISYGVHDDLVHIHLAPMETLGMAEKMKLVRDGFVALAKILKERPDIQTVQATSWIVGEHPRVMERMGFTVQAEVDKDFKQEHFADDDRKIGRAVMSREDFLKKYLPK